MAIPVAHAARARALSRVGVGLLLLASLSSCAWETLIGFPVGAVHLEPLPVYRRWWAETEACSGRTGSFDAIRWYVVPHAYTLPDGNDGEWYPADDRIVVAEGAFRSGELVRHEMLHALVRRGGHPRSAFLEKCAGIVSCIGHCLRDAGPPPPPPAGAVHVSPRALDIHLSVSSRTPSSAVDGGFFSMTVTARNAATTPVVVDLPPSGDAGPPVSYTIKVSQRGGYWWYDMRADDAEVTYFAPGETKRFQFDLTNTNLQTEFSAPPGTWMLHGAYGDVWAPDSVTVTVSP